MRQVITSEHLADANGLPAGGTTVGLGIEIRWQAGPLPHPDRLTRDPVAVMAEDVGANGAFVEGVIQAAIDRIGWYQVVSGGRFACDENAMAVRSLELAIATLDSRTRQRAARGVLGTHKV